MILNGKAKLDFKEWKVNNKNLSTIEVLGFNLLSEVSQNALIIEWFDSVGIFIEVSVDQITDKNKCVPNCFYSSAIFHVKHRTNEGRTLTQLNTNISRQQATEQAIIKANDIYNERFRL